MVPIEAAAVGIFWKEGDPACEKNHKTLLPPFNPSHSVPVRRGTQSRVFLFS